MSDAEIVFADQFRGDKNIVACLFEIFSRDAEEAEALGGQFKHAIGFDFRAVESSGPAVFALVTLSAVVRVSGAIVAMAWVLIGLRIGRWRSALIIAFAGAAFPFVAAALAAGFARLRLALSLGLALALLRVALLKIAILAVLALSLPALVTASLMGRSFTLAVRG